MSELYALTRDDLLMWADTGGADQQLSILVRRLALETDMGVDRAGVARARQRS